MPEESSPLFYTPDPKYLSGLITAMYHPAASASETDELVSNTDILEQLRMMEPELSPKHVYDAMTELGFVPKNIEGAVYWPVMVV